MGPMGGHRTRSDPLLRWRIRRHLRNGDLLAAQRLILRRLRKEFG